MFSWLHMTLTSMSLFILWPASQQASKQEVLPVCSFGVSRRFGSQAPACTGGHRSPTLTMTDPRWAGDKYLLFSLDLRYVVLNLFCLLWSIASLNIQIKFWWGPSPVWSQRVHTSVPIHLLHSTWFCLLYWKPFSPSSSDQLQCLAPKIYNFSQEATFVLCY